jgi:hypothetical protein
MMKSSAASLQTLTPRKEARVEFQWKRLKGLTENTMHNADADAQCMSFTWCYAAHCSLLTARDVSLVTLSSVQIHVGAAFN